MASIYEVEVTIDSGKDLKNVNWKHGNLRPYVVVWVDPSAKATTKVDAENDDDPLWDEKLVVPVCVYDRHSAIEDAVLFIDVVHDKNDEEEGVKPLVGFAKLPLWEVIDEAGIGETVVRKLKLKRPSGRPHGKIEAKVCVREPSRYHETHPPPASCGTTPYNSAGPHGHHESVREFDGSYGYNQPPPPVGYPYGEPPHSEYPYGAPPPTGYPYGGPPPHMSSYGGEMAPPQTEEKKSKFGGMGTGLAVGAVVGVAGGFALAEGLDHLEDDIAEDAAEKVEDDLVPDDDDGDGDE